MYLGVTAIGRLVHDPELKKNGNTSYCSFRIAINQKISGKENTIFKSCLVYGRMAENLCQYKKKGDLLIVDGQGYLDEYKKTDGTTISQEKMFANKITFMNSGEGGQANKTAPKPKFAQNNYKADDDFTGGDDIPF